MGTIPLFKFTVKTNAKNGVKCYKNVRQNETKLAKINLQGMTLAVINQPNTSKRSVLASGILPVTGYMYVGYKNTEGNFLFTLKQLIFIQEKTAKHDHGFASETQTHNIRKRRVDQM